MNIQLGNKQINYEIVRGDRKKTVAIHVGPDAITVRAPKQLGQDRIIAIMKKKAGVIIDRQERIRRESSCHPPKEFVSGESFPYLGKQYRLKIIKSVNGLNNKCHLINGRLQVEINKNLEGEKARDAVKEALTNWYKIHATEKINDRLPHLAKKLGRKPTAVQIKDQKRRWASCSRTGVIRFNWKIIAAPVSVLDYLIVHELCHLFYQNHSISYWAKVRTIIPDFRRSRTWLKDHSFIIGDAGLSLP
jgi:predicted metal-dependent hydrolase